MSDVCYSEPSNLIDRSNYLICHLAASPVSPNTLSFLLHHYICNVLYINDQKNQLDTDAHVLHLLSQLFILSWPYSPKWTYTSLMALFHSFIFLDVLSGCKKYVILKF
jgi:hypothetical protein